MGTPETFNITSFSRQIEYMPAACSNLLGYSSLSPSFAISQSTTLWSQTTQHGLLSRENAIFLFLIHLCWIHSGLRIEFYLNHITEQTFKGAQKSFDTDAVLDTLSIHAFLAGDMSGQTALTNQH